LSYSGNRGALGYNNASLSSQDQERNLINADEIIKLPLDSFILICQGLPPYIGKKNVYYQDTVFTRRLCPEAFKTREEALRAARKTIAKLNGPQWFDFPEGRAQPVSPDAVPPQEPEEEFEEAIPDLSEAQIAELSRKLETRDENPASSEVDDAPFAFAESGSDEITNFLK
jgi:type IV secretory pathway TraG/TraD family ATPase VirD4